MLASDPNPIEYLSWWSAIIGTLLAGIGTVITLVMLWWAWEQRRDARQAARSRRRRPAKNKRAARPGGSPARPPKTGKPAAATATAAAGGRTRTATVVASPDGAGSGDSVSGTSAGAGGTVGVGVGGVGPTDRGVAPGRARHTARRVMPAISAVLAIMFVALLGGLFIFVRLERETSYGQLVVARGDAPTGRSTNHCESGLCPVTDHWSLTGDTRHVTFGYVGLERPRTQHGKAVVGVAAPGCDAGPQVRWQALIDGRPVANGTAGAVKSGKVLDVATGQTITMVVDRTSTAACAVDLQVTSMVFFAPDQVWKLMEDQGLRLQP